MKNENFRAGAVGTLVILKNLNWESTIPVATILVFLAFICNFTKRYGLELISSIEFVNRTKPIHNT